MKNMVQRTILGFLFLLSTQVYADKKETFSDYSEAIELSEKIMKFIEKEDYDGAYGAARKYWPLPDHEVDTLAYQTNQQVPIIQGRFGRAIGVEFVSRQQVGESFAREWYIQKYENHALVWLFTFYNGKNG